MFGRQRFEAALQRSMCDIEKVRKGLHRFTGHEVGVSTQDDDISLVCVNTGKITFKKGKDKASGQEAYESLRAAIPWQITLKLGMPELRSGSPVSQVVDMVSEATGLYSHKPALVLLLVELFNNALEHGLLELHSSLKDEPDGYIGYYAEREKRLKSYTDGQINIQDIIFLINYILDLDSPNDNQFSNADMNGDDILNIQDIILILNVILS